MEKDPMNNLSTTPVTSARRAGSGIARALKAGVYVAMFLVLIAGAILLWIYHHPPAQDDYLKPTNQLLLRLLESCTTGLRDPGRETQASAKVTARGDSQYARTPPTSDASAPINLRSPNSWRSGMFAVGTC